MPKKPKADPQEASLLAEAARISPQQIWQAGLGAFLKAQEEGDRAFSRLVSDGHELQQRAKARAKEDTQAPTPASWHALEAMFEDRVARALAAMAVPTHHDLDRLRAQVEQLQKTVDGLTAPSKKPAGKKKKEAA